MARPSLLTSEMYAKIRELLKERRSMEEVAELCGIGHRTLQGWYYDEDPSFRVFYDTCNHERMLKKAEKNQEEYLSMQTKQIKVIDGVELEYIDPALEKIKQDSTKFVQETLGKKYYSKRTENTGKDGEAIAVTIEDLLTKKHVDTTGKGDIHGEWSADSGQEQITDAVSAEQRTEALPLQQEQPQPDTQGEAAGV